jgi:MraZ protein
MFTGSHPLTIDDKGRLAIPARFRQQLAEGPGRHGSRVYITRSYQPCVEIYPLDKFHDVVEQIDRMEDRKKADLAMWAFIGHAEETEIDKQGRVLVPQLLRKLATLESKAVAVGQHKRIEIWAEDMWAAKATGGIVSDLADAFAQVRR